MPFLQCCISHSGQGVAAHDTRPTCRLLPERVGCRHNRTLHFLGDSNFLRRQVRLANSGLARGGWYCLLVSVLALEGFFCSALKQTVLRICFSPGGEFCSRTFC